jgi:hypothetical protein
VLASSARFPRVSVEEVDVFVRPVGHVPEMAADRDGSEAGLLELNGAISDVVRMRRGSIPVAGHDGVVVRLHLDPELVAPRREDMLGVDDGECPVRSKKPRRLRVPRFRVDPVERSERHDPVELSSLRLPCFERSVHDLHDREGGELPARDRSEALAELDADDLQTARGQRQRRLTCPASDLENAAAVGQTGELDEVVEDRVGIDRTRSVVELGDLLERPPPRAPGRLGVAPSSDRRAGTGSRNLEQFRSETRRRACRASGGGTRRRASPGRVRPRPARPTRARAAAPG